MFNVLVDVPKKFSSIRLKTNHFNTCIAHKGLSVRVIVRLCAYKIRKQLITTMLKPKCKHMFVEC